MGGTGGRDSFGFLMVPYRQRVSIHQMTNHLHKQRRYPSVRIVWIFFILKENRVDNHGSQSTPVISELIDSIGSPLSYKIQKLCVFNSPHLFRNSHYRPHYGRDHDTQSNDEILTTRGVLVILIGLMVLLIYVTLSSVTFDDDTITKTVLGAFNDWRQCMIQQVDSARNEPQKMKFSPPRGVLVILIGLMVLLIYVTLSSVTFDDDTITKTVLGAFNDWRQCMIQQVDSARNEPQKLWNSFSKIVRHCTSSTDVSRINLVPLENSDEIKYFIISDDVTTPKVVVSLGIGEDIRAEQKLQKLLPNGSLFYGADPVTVTNAELFSKIGTFFPLAISRETGRYQSHIRLSNGAYEPMTVVNIDVITFFTKMVNHTYIDYLIMDNEGPEYEIVPMIVIDDSFEQNNIIPCQMNVEFHVPPPHDRYGKFATIMWKMLEVGRYGILHSVNVGHQRMFIVNFDNPYCLEKYLEQYFPV
ncbi:hypothetical protein DICVIV_06447 [Dictyocaulus viviparus]|uniref:Methyltransferase FkbM domain-containing protein n=1 Tax=Dictyocaulus viviparus TaxID=29172 RepID=A0A0D8XSF1_DICVI|nr:hypothetical protein DICVIV_06447 [Dictyocaulus viviparus]